MKPTIRTDRVPPSCRALLVPGFQLLGVRLRDGHLRWHGGGCYDTHFRSIFWTRMHCCSFAKGCRIRSGLQGTLSVRHFLAFRVSDDLGVLSGTAFPNAAASSHLGLFAVSVTQRTGSSDAGKCEQSYNSFYAPPAAQQAVAINTYLALLGSSIAGLSASAIFNGNLKLNIFDAQRSSVAGELDASLSEE